MKIDDFSTRDRIGIAISIFAIIASAISQISGWYGVFAYLAIYWGAMFILKKIDFLFVKKT